MAAGDLVAILKQRDNHIINGGMLINERKEASLDTPISTANDSYRLDRWRTFSNDPTTANQQLTWVSAPSLPSSAKLSGLYSQKWNRAAGGADTRVLGAEQRIEFFDQFSNRAVTVSCWMKSNHADARLAIRDSNLGSTVNAVVQHPGDGNWHYLQATYDAGVVPQITVYCAIMEDDRTGASLNTGDFIEFTAVKLEIAKIASKFDLPNQVAERRLAKRYYERFDNSADTQTPFFNAFYAGSGQAQGTLTYVEKRAQPTIGFAAADRFQAHDDATDRTGTGVGSVQRGLNAALIFLNISGATSGEGCIVRGEDPDAFIAVEAEM